jgi:hypothetical protein
MALAGIRGLRRAAPAALVATALLLGGCTSSGVGGGRRAAGPAAPGPPGGPSKYQAAVDAAAARGLEVWLEGDLTRRWLAGPGPFRQGVARLAALARRPGVAGIKLADELGYHDGLDHDPARVAAFLRDAAAALRAAAPGKRLLADLLVPELGCAPGAGSPRARVAGAACRARARRTWPALRVERVDGYLGSGALDVVNLSTGLLEAGTYRGWGLDRDAAQRLAWAAVRRRGWGAMVRLQARKALAFPGRYRGGVARAAADLRTFVDLPWQQGARGVDVWTWRQRYRGRVVRLMDPGDAGNPLWAGLRARRAAGVVLLTHFTPSSTERGLAADLDALATVFTGVYTAAGIG